MKTVVEEVLLSHFVENWIIGGSKSLNVSKCLMVTEKSYIKGQPKVKCAKAFNNVQLKWMFYQTVLISYKEHRDPATTECLRKEWTILRGTATSSGDFPQLDPNNEGQALQMQKSSYEEDTVG